MNDNYQPQQPPQQPQQQYGPQQPYGSRPWEAPEKKHYVNKVALVSFCLPIVGLMMIIGNPFDSEWFSNIGMGLIGIGVCGSLLAWAYKPRWQAAIGCLPGIIVIVMFLIIGVAVGQHHPPRHGEEPVDSNEVVMEPADSNEVVDVPADSAALNNANQ